MYTEFPNTCLRISILSHTNPPGQDFYSIFFKYKTLCLQCNMVQTYTLRSSGAQYRRTLLSRPTFMSLLL